MRITIYVNSTRRLVIFLIIFVITVCYVCNSNNLVEAVNSKDFSSKIYVNETINAFTQQIARKSGRLIIGALLPIHTSKEGACSNLYVDGMMLTQAFIFGLKEARERSLLPEGFSLGYEIRDTCNLVPIAQQHVTSIVLERHGYKKDVKICSSLAKKTDEKRLSGNVIAVLGAGNSEISIAINRVLSAFQIPQIGFASTSSYLSEKMRFSSFFRTVPPDTNQVSGLLALLKKLSWNYVGILFSSGDYGRALVESFKSLGKAEGICIAYDYSVPYSVTLDAAKGIVNKIKRRVDVEILIIFVPEIDVKILLSAMLDVGLANKTLIASDSWSKAIKNKTLSKIVSGTLGLAHHYTPVKKFEDHFLHLKPTNNTWNIWFNETWEYLFDCKLSPSESIRNVNTVKNKTNCNIKSQKLKREQFSRFHYVSNVINGVFAIAAGITKSLNNKRNAGVSVTSRELLKSLEEITFQKYNGQYVKFDKKGNVGGKYNLVNIYSDLTPRHVGIWNGSSLELNEKEIQWHSVLFPPKGVCSILCLPGEYQVASKKDPQCCWNCQRCPPGTITNRPNATTCTPCSEHYVTNSQQSGCVYIPLSYLDWGDFWTISIIILASVSIIILLIFLIVFIHFLNTPVVKSANRELSLLLLVGLFCTFIVPFAFAGKPSKFKCIISQVVFCLGCALALSAMLFKTLRIVLLFTLSYRGCWLLKNKYQIAMTITITLCELVYCLLWIAVDPPGIKILSLKLTKRYIVCNFNKYWYGGSHILLIFLSIMCTIFAVKGRKLPKNFNEVRHIGLSMFTFNIVWVVFMCAQYGASLDYDVKINCLAMIISSLMILVLLFGPKVHILLFRSHLNKKEEFQNEIRRYSFGISNGINSTSAAAASFQLGSLLSDLCATSAPNSQFSAAHNSSNKRQCRSHSFDVTSTQRNFRHHLFTQEKETQTEPFNESFQRDVINLTKKRDEKTRNANESNSKDLEKSSQANSQDECVSLLNEEDKLFNGSDNNGSYQSSKSSFIESKDLSFGHVKSVDKERHFKHSCELPMNETHSLPDIEKNTRLNWDDGDCNLDINLSNFCKDGHIKETVL